MNIKQVYVWKFSTKFGRWISIVDPVYAAEGNYLWKMELNLSVILWRSENKATRRRCAEPLRNT